MRAKLVAISLLALGLVAPAVVANHAQTDAGKTVTFHHKTGNEWWVEVYVSGPSANALAGVDARDTGGDWKALSLKSWDAWAASFHIEPGHLVQFRARFTDGSTLTSCEFTHPGGEERCGGAPPPPPPESNFSATFEPKPGNEWWVEVRVTASGPLAKVQARAHGGAWVDLTLRSWGAWAKSFHVPDGSHVQFQAISTTGEAALSGEYRWPDATPIAPAPEPTPWPREGSFVRFDSTDTNGSPVGADGYDATVTYRFTGGAWQVACEGVQFSQYPGLAREAEPFARPLEASAGPPLAPPRLEVGQVAPRVTYLEGCAPRTLENVSVVSEFSWVVYRDGKPLEVRALEGAWESEPSYARLTWEAETGMLLAFTECSAPSSGCDFGRYENSDAPLPGTPREERGWERHGSFALYDVAHATASTQGGGSEREELRVTYRYEYGRWEVVCDGTAAWTSYDGTTRMGHSYEKFTSQPPFLPIGVSNGHVLDAAHPAACFLADMDVVVKGQFPEDTTVNGAPFRAHVYWADEPDAVDARGDDRDAWWDARFGLLLRWEDAEHTDTTRWTTYGKLVDTNAPLTPG